MIFKDRPRIKIESKPREQLVLGIGWLAWIALLIMPMIYYSDLPQEVPRHYEFSGKADAWSQKSVIWTLPLIGSVLFFGILVLRRYPHLFNYPVKITPENAEHQYDHARRLLSTIIMVVMLGFAYITYTTIAVSHGQQSGLGNWFAPLFISILLGIIAYYLYKLLK